MLSQLEHAFSTSPQFTLQKLWFYVHPTLHTLSLLYLLITELATADDPSAAMSDSDSDSTPDPEEEVRNEALGLGGAKLKAVLSDINKGSTLGVDDSASGIVKGGEVLAILHERMQNMSGDPAARALYGALSRATGKPYVEMVQVWIRTGRLVDPYEELCVKESKFIDRGTLEMDYVDEYWERRYTVQDQCIQSVAIALMARCFSFVTEQPSVVHQSNIRQACLHHVQPMVAYLEVPASLRLWSDGKRRCYWLGSI